jgi:hypothetical protein
MGIYVRLQKLADDGTRATYAFSPGEGADRTLIFDRAEGRIWPQDGARDGIFRAAAGTVAKAWAEHGELPDKLLHQA